MSSTREISNIQETYLAKKFNLYRSPNSGGGKFKKGDLYSKEADITVECKSSMTEKSSFSVQKEWLIKAKDEAHANGIFNSCVAISFIPDGNENYFIIDEKLFSLLLAKLKEENI